MLITIVNYFSGHCASYIYWVHAQKT